MMKRDIFEGVRTAIAVALLFLVLGVVPALAQVGGRGGVGGLPRNPDFNNVQVDGNLNVNGTATLAGVASSDFARRSQSNTFTAGTNTFESTNPSTIMQVRVQNAADSDSGLNLCVPAPGVAGDCLADNTGDEPSIVTDYPLRIGVDGSTGDTALLVDSAALTAYGVDMTPVHGTFTVDFIDGCTTTPSITVEYYRIGELVTLTTRDTISCTADVALFQSNGGNNVPVGLRPGTATNAGFVIGSDTADPLIVGQLRFETDGDVVILKCGAIDVPGGTSGAPSCGLGTTWSSSGTKTASAWSVSYVR